MAVPGEGEGQALDGEGEGAGCSGGRGAAGRGRFDLGFEVASAFGTTGLTRGATSDLDTFGRFVIMVVMFLGRVGPLTLGFLLATRSMPRVRYPTAQVHLG